MDLAPLPVAVSCDYATYTDRRGMPAAHFRLDACYARALEQQNLFGLAAPHPLQPVGAGDLARRAATALASVTGLLVTGGDFDVPPQRYGQPPHAKLGTVLPQRTDFEWALLNEAERRGLPVLGICGGLQLIVVSRGGSLHQDSSLRADTQQHVQPNDRAQPFHDVDVAPKSLLARALNATRCGVNSTHHQVVDRVGRGLQVVATAPDGVVEAVQNAPGGPFLLAVQWHPEAMTAPRQAGIYAAFAAACAAYAQTNTEVAAAQPARSGV